MRALVAMAVVLTAGCSPSLAWYRPNTTQQEWNRDGYECRRETVQPATQPMTPIVGDNFLSSMIGGYQLGTAMQGQQEREDLFDMCMQARGYRLVPRGYRP
jgi:hypothetical protein